jgi:small conductance mechanosensitive channel
VGGERITDRIDANARETDALVRSEASKHRHSLAQVANWAAVVAIYIVAAMMVLSRLGCRWPGWSRRPRGRCRLGFGAQRIVQDLLAGFFIITSGSTASATSSAWPSSASASRAPARSRTSPCA